MAMNKTFPLVTFVNGSPMVTHFHTQESMLKAANFLGGSTEGLKTELSSVKKIYHAAGDFLSGMLGGEQLGKPDQCLRAWNSFKNTFSHKTIGDTFVTIDGNFTIGDREFHHIEKVWARTVAAVEKHNRQKTHKPLLKLLKWLDNNAK